MYSMVRYESWMVHPSPPFQWERIVPRRWDKLDACAYNKKEPVPVVFLGSFEQAPAISESIGLAIVGRDSTFQLIQTCPSWGSNFHCEQTFCPSPPLSIRNQETCTTRDRKVAAIHIPQLSNWRQSLLLRARVLRRWRFPFRSGNINRVTEFPTESWCGGYTRTVNILSGMTILALSVTDLQGDDDSFLL